MSWQLLGHAVKVALAVKRLDDYIRGGLIAEALSGMGDVMFESARQHLAEAANSPHPTVRLADAASDFQTAYIAFDTSAQKGNDSLKKMALRLGVGGTDACQIHGNAADSAAMAALLRHLLGEPHEVQRRWLDRVAKHVSVDWRIRNESGVLGDPSLKRSLGASLSHYYQLEYRLLGAENLRPYPPGLRDLFGPAQPLPGSGMLHLPRNWWAGLDDPEVAHRLRRGPSYLVLPSYEDW